MEWYRKTIDEVITGLSIDLQTGLSTDEARLRLGKYGPNSLTAAKRESRVIKFLKQFTEFIILVLIGAAVVAAALGEWVDSLAIVGIVVFNGVIGFLQEEKAERVIESLKKLAAPNAKVFRDGEFKTIPASELVPGDVVMLESGDNVPADARVIDSRLLRIQEASLTGESLPVDKGSDELAESVPLADRVNMAYSGTHVVYGRGSAVVAATGMSTEMGNIARMLAEVRPEPTPLQRKLSQLAKSLVYGSGAVCAVIFALGILRGGGVLDMFLTAVSLAVAAIPEGLPAVVTITLALGVQGMVRRNALVRKLQSVETLGSATVIASDKTGTITQNQMTVRRVYLSTGEIAAVTGSGYSPSGAFFKDTKEFQPANDTALLLALKAAVLCNTAELKENNGAGWAVMGDPTEGALLALGKKAGLKKSELLKDWSFIGEAPFDSDRKMMTMVFRDNGSGLFYAFTKGAPERVLALCSDIYAQAGARPITGRDLDHALLANEEFSKGAMRVLGLAYRTSRDPLDVKSPSLLERELTFIGLAGMIDPPREEVFLAVEKARAAGITPVMITGDHKLTAVAIARETGLFRDGDIAVSGDELDGMTDDEFRERLPNIKVYARVSPEHKLKVIRAWKDRGDVIAMTGDGINDAPALKEADIGIAMGITGTDVTKEASDMVLTDDNFASIISAVEEGRGIFDNIRKAVHFLLSCNIGEILVLLVASVAGMPLPLLPVQILWTNLVTDGLPAIGLAMEKVDPVVMERLPRKRDEGVVTRPLLIVMLVQGVFIALCTLAVYTVELYWFNSSLIKARTTAFTVLIFCQKFHIFNCRSMFDSVFKLGLFTNRMLNAAVAFVLLSQVLLVYTPSLQRIFKVEALGLIDWAIVFAASIQPLLMMEIAKRVWPRQGRKPV
ncbi:MAG: cation-translocating P-type ATPase [Deltaproteobacteria bacterium]|nr:cation-translocating P-type ATPase [Deltaproteobacteria bacterium]